MRGEAPPPPGSEFLQLQIVERSPRLDTMARFGGTPDTQPAYHPTPPPNPRPHMSSSPLLPRPLTRRQFAQKAAAASALFSAPAFLRGQNLNSKLNLAMIGSGGRGVDATVGEIAGALRQVFGEHRETLVL